MGLHHRSSTVTAKVLIVNVALILLSHAILQVEGQDIPPQVCLIGCGIKAIACAAGCLQNPLCLLGCGVGDLACVASCNGKSEEIPTVVPRIEVAGRGETQIQMGTVKAVAVISSSSGGDNLTGSLQFLQNSSTGVTHVKGRIDGLTPGLHSLHIHALGDTINGCISAGPQFNPLNQDHGAPSDQNHHAGYLGNIIAGRDGVAEILITHKQIPLNGPHSIVGRAVVVHANTEDLGRRGNELSKTTGNDGARVGCGIIKLQSSV